MTTPEPTAPPALPNVSGVRIAGFTIPAPAALAMAFADRATITGPELCRLLPIDPETLRRHIRAGHISYVRIGFGDRRAFTLDSIMRFLESRSVTEQPPERKQRRRAAQPADKPQGFLARVARLRAEEAAEKERKNASHRADKPSSLESAPAMKRRLAAERRQRVAERA